MPRCTLVILSLPPVGTCSPHYLIPDDEMTPEFARTFEALERSIGQYFRGQYIDQYRQNVLPRLECLTAADRAWYSTGRIGLTGDRVITTVYTLGLPADGTYDPEACAPRSLGLTLGGVIQKCVAQLV